MSGEFDLAAFSPNIATSATARADQTNFTVTVGSQHARCIRNKNAWLQLTETMTCQSGLEQDSTPKRSRLDFSELTPELSESLTDTDDLSPGKLARSFSNIQEALQWITRGLDYNVSRTIMVPGTNPDVLTKAKHIQILCTGSLHLVGGVIGLVDPDFNDS